MSHRTGKLTHYLDSLFSHYGYGVVGVVVMLESMGLPLPAESLIITAALYCATTHRLDITWVAVAAVTGAIMGDNFGYLIGRALGLKILQKYGIKIGLTSDRLLLGRYLFRRHGNVVVFLGRFVAILRIFVALLAGASHMPWHSFLLYNALGGMAWAGGYTFATYYLGSRILNVTGPVAIAMGCVGGAALLAGFLFIRKNEKKLLDEAMVQARSEEKPLSV
ncbi:DedA family protein [Acetobacter sp. AN02]|uniref:DedA family protein n=1 Tax=Acetobacter sp. AN02 TaxID=2894186 RepID=UPI0024344E44|nr:DedA family protein [Acetobacter sp. AN02]MDG6095509.1 DedA family protein [Acetobacter sp. AN02]